MLEGAGYRQIGADKVPGWKTVWAVCRWNLRIIFRQKLFWALVVLGMLHFLVHYVLIYIKAQISIESPAFARFIDNYQVTGSGAAYRAFLEGQSRAVLILLAYAGVVLVAADFRSGGIAFYLSKPIGKLEYVLGKLLALWLIVGLLTVVPALVLYLEYGFFSSSTQYWRDNPRIVLGIVGYSTLLMTIPSLLLLAVGAVCRRGAPLVMVWCSIFLVLPAFGGLLRQVFQSQYWLLVNLWRNLRLLGEFYFDARDPLGDPFVIVAGLLTIGVAAGSMMILDRRLRAVEVVE